MSDESGQRVYQVRGNGMENKQPGVGSLGQKNTQTELVQVPPVVVHTQAGVALMQTGILHNQPLVHTNINAHSQVQTHSQISAHTQTLQSLGHTPTHVHVQPHTTIQPQTHLQQDNQIQQQAIIQQQQTPTQHKLVPPQTHTTSQTLPQPLTEVSPLTRAHLVYTQPQLQAESQIQTQEIHTQPQVHTHTQIHTHSPVQIPPQIHTQAQLHIQPQVHTNSQVQVQSLTHAQQQHVEAQPQLSHSQCSLQPQLPSAAQTPIMHTIGDLAEVQLQSSNQQAAKGSDSLIAVRVPVTRQHDSSAFNARNLQTTSLELGQVQTANSQAQLNQTLTSLSQELSTSLNQAQIVDALGTERVFVASKNNNVQSAVTPGSSVTSVGIDGISVMRLQGNFNIRLEDSSLPMRNSPKTSSTTEVPIVQQLVNSDITSPQLDTSQLTTAPISSLHVIPQGSIAPSEVKKNNAQFNSLIMNNKLLNKMLDTIKPHIPSQVSKAAEIAHLLPNPTIRTTTGQRIEDLEDGSVMAFAASNRGTSPLTTSANNPGASICTVTGALHGSSGYGDSVDKTATALQLDNIVGLSTNFQVNNNTIILPSSMAQGQTSQQRQFDNLQQVLGTQVTKQIVEPQLDDLKGDQLRIWATTVPTTQLSQVTTSNSSNISSTGHSTAEKNLKRTNPPAVHQTNANLKSYNVMCVQDGLNKTGMLLDMPVRPQGSVCTKSGMITSIDPMFPTVVVTSGSSSPTSLGTYGTSKTSGTSQEATTRVRLADLLNRGSSADTLLGGGMSLSLMGLSEARLPHTGDVLLSELHRSDESDLSLSASLTGSAADELHSSASALVTEASLGPGIGGDTAPLQGLPSPPLPSFSLPNITSDFMVSGVSNNKACPSNQGPLPALLSNLATTADLDQFLENSNMCIDMNSLSESDASLSTGPGAFVYSPEKADSLKKSSTTSSADLTFTSALKAATNKSENEQLKLGSELESSSRLLQHQDSVVLIETTKSSTPVAPSKTSASGTFSGQFLSSQVSSGTQKAQSSSTKKSEGQAKNTGHSEKRKEIFRKNELLVQQVACFKCRLCSCLSQDRSLMVKHMKEMHSQYLSESEESEEEVERPASKRVKVFVPRSESSQSEGSPPPNPPIKAKEKSSKKKQKEPVDKVENPKATPGKGKKKVKVEEERQANGTIGVFIKAEPKEDEVLVKKECEKETVEDEDLKLTIDLENRGENRSDQDYDDDDTNDSTTTNDSGSVSSVKTYLGKGEQPLYNKNAGIKLKRSNSKVSLPDKSHGIKCDVNGCSVRLKSESNIAYHRKCHAENSMQCQECPTKFGTWRDLALHLWRHHLIDIDLHKCDKCDYKCYSYSKLMNVHHKIHSDERPSLCDTCGKRFKTTKQLRNHKALHLKVPQILCETCQRPFTDKRMLRNHIEFVHKKVKPFLCNYCGYSTASKSTLKMHMRQHTGEKPFACEECSYRTADHNSLRRHKMQHSGIRPYRCPYCEYASIQSTTFKVHLKDKHPGLAQMNGIMFTCVVCPFKTIKRDNYLAHVAEHSKNDNKKLRQSVSSTTTTTTVTTTTTTTTTATKPPSPETIVSDMTPPPPHVVNIDVNSGAVTVESPQETDFLSNVSVPGGLQLPIPGQLIMAGDQYFYAALDSTVLSQVQSNERVLRLTPLVVTVPVTSEASSSPSQQELVYVASTSQGGQ
ncbi:serine-rich adhesin for platelets-like isoform X2 [Penaeus japonicus]|nr:serine-rich adhesin for platelets-like isoform X2 [Penaeus japonicus]XP_042873760.1 serine-rich adhesin for platelets-like isoform X2 [Penaeus japonicus]